MGETLLLAGPETESRLAHHEAALIMATPSFGEGESGSGNHPPEPLSLAGASLKILRAPGKFPGCCLPEAAQLPLTRGLLLSPLSSLGN